MGGTLLAARALGLLWAGFWLFFFVAESLAWHTPLAALAAWTAVGLAFALAVAAAWRAEFLGGLLLIGVGALAGLAYAVRPPEHLTASVRLGTALALGAPPVIAGLLFLRHHFATTRRHA
jgi:hypothetical protein